MKFSVITVCRNAASTIDRALASIAEQDYSQIESLVVDGLSNDGTAERARRAVRPGGRVVSEADSGLYNAMNKGVALATGDVVAFLNADDWYPRETIISEVAAQFAETGVEAVFGDVAFFRPGDMTRPVRRYRSGRFQPWLLRFGLMPAHPATFVRREIFERVGPFAEDYAIAADFDMAVRMFGVARTRFTHYPHVLVNMALGGVSTSGVRAAMTINAETVRACRSNGIYTNTAMVSAKYPLKLVELLA